MPEENKSEEVKSPIKAIRAHCLDCAGSTGEVRKCPSTTCKLFPFRFGTNPFCKRGTEEANAKRSEALKKRWQVKKLEAKL